MSYLESLIPDRSSEEISEVDALDDVLGRMHVEGSWYAGLRATAPWAVSFGRAELARLVVIVDGECLLTGRQLDAPMKVSAGDCLIVQTGVWFTLQDQLARPAVSCESVFADAGGPEASIGGGGPATMIQCGRFSYDLTAAEPLMRLLPDICRIRLDEASNTAIRATLDLMATEVTHGCGVGAGSILDRLADVLFIQALRAWCTSEDGMNVGWVAALGVPPLAAAMRAMHSDLARQWTVADLATVATMSRSSFAALFRKVIGEPPLSYLTRWRVYRAKTLLRETRRDLTDIAAEVGYESGTALSRVFRKYEPLPPGTWRKTNQPTLTSVGSSDVPQ